MSGEEDARARALALLDAVDGRADAKRLGARLDAEPALREAVLALAAERGLDLPEEAASWPGKRLLRRALGRAEEAQARVTPIALDEGFTCVHCGLVVGPAGRGCRDHCPRCLRSVHLDVVPGDRSAGCGARMDPVGLVLEHGEPVITFRCVRCGAERRTRALLVGEQRDDARALARLSAGEAP